MCLLKDSADRSKKIDCNIVLIENGFAHPASELEYNKNSAPDCFQAEPNIWQYQCWQKLQKSTSTFFMLNLR